MAVSPSGLCTLLALILIGPLIYAVRYFCRRRKALDNGADASKQSDHAEDEHHNMHPIEDHREEMSTTAYTFGLVGYAIGIGNVWRFPYVIASNGGAAAVVAYLICAVCVAVPLFLYEMILGQYTKLSCVPTWKHIRSRYLSFGLSQGLLVFIANVYFCMVIAYTIPYIFSSVQDPLPWTENGSKDYWFNTILNQYEDINDKPRGAGPIQWHLALSLLMLWTLIFVCIVFGKKILAKVTYVTVIMPVVLMLILVVRTAVLPGASDGIAFYLGKFEAEKLRDFNVWATALSQILFSLSPGFGTSITYSSYTKPKEDVYRVCMIVAVANSTFSLIGGFAIFSMVGNLAYEQNLPVSEVASSGGTGLAFIIIASAMESFGPMKNVMSVLFFVMLLTLGLDSAFAWTETIVSVAEDIMEMCHMPKPRLWKTALGVCATSFILGLVYTTRMGNEILDVVDHYVGVTFLLLVCFIEAVILNFEVGWRRLELALKSATIGLKGLPTGRKIFPSYLCRFDFHVAVPVATIGLGLYTFVQDIREPYGGYPRSMLAWGWTLLALCIVTVFLTMFKCGDESGLPPIEDDEKLQAGLLGEGDISAAKPADMTSDSGEGSDTIAVPMDVESGTA